MFSCEIWEILKNTYFEEHLNNCFCALITSSYIDFYYPLQYTFYIFTNNFFFITQLKLELMTCEAVTFEEVFHWTKFLAFES